ncbi:hypothetical protein ACWDA9_18385 [Streptomyces sp. NPDC001193]
MEWPGWSARCRRYATGAISVHLTGGDRRIGLNIGLVLTAAVTVWPATRL